MQFGNRLKGNTMKAISILTTVLMSIVGLTTITSNALAAENVTSCGFSQDGGTTYQQHLDVAIAAGSSANILTEVSPSIGSLIRDSAGFVLKTDKFSDFVSGGVPWGYQYPGDPTQGAYPFNPPTRITENDSSNNWNYDMNSVFFGWGEGSFSPQTYYFEYRYYSGAYPYGLICSIIVDYSPKAPAVNYGHSDKTAISADRSRLEFSTDPSGQKTKK